VFMAYSVWYIIHGTGHSVRTLHIPQGTVMHGIGYTECALG